VSIFLMTSAASTICTAFQKYDRRSAFLWKYADPVLDHYAYLAGGSDPAALAAHRQDEAGFAVGFAERFEIAQRTLVKAVKAAIAEADAAPPGERVWRNFCGSFARFDRDMAVFWKALQTVLDHYEAHLPDDPANLAVHYHEVTLLAFEFVHRLGREWKALDREMRSLL
jgi:hypothetical protein